MPKKLYFLFLLIGLSNGQQSACFSQQKFEKAYDEALINFQNLEDKLFKSVHSGDCGIPKDSPIYAHFQSSRLSPEILEHDKFATVSNIALKVLQSEKSYRMKAFRACLSNIVTSKYCTPLSSSCTVAETRFVILLQQLKNPKKSF